MKCQGYSSDLRFGFLTSMLAVAVLGGSTIAAGQPCDSIDKQTSPDPQIAEQFGTDVDIQGEFAIVGAPQHFVRDVGYTGAAYLFRRQGGVWSHDATLLDPDGQDSDLFGHSVAVHSDLAVVGVPTRHRFTDDEPGAFVYRYDPLAEVWQFETMLQPQGTAAAFNWGLTVVVSDGVIAVATSDIIMGDAHSVAQIFRHDPNTDDWTFEQQVTLSDPGILFFWQPANWMSLSGNTFIGGEAGNAGTTRGVSFIYEYDGLSWNSAETLTSPAADPTDFFGLSSTLRGDTAIVSAVDDSQAGAPIGAAHIYRQDGSGWQFEQTLTPPPGTDYDNFGIAAVVDGPNALVTGTLIEAGQPDRAAVWHFAFDGGTGLWEHCDTYFGDPANPDALFGRHLALDGGVAVVSSESDDEIDTDSGAVYFIDGIQCVQYERGDSNADGTTGVVDFLAVLMAWGPCVDNCPADGNGDGIVGIIDFLNVLSNWSATP